MPDITKLTKETAMDVYLAPNGLDPYIAQIKAEIDSFVPDTSTSKSRREIASFAMKISKSKTYLDSIGKDLVDVLKKQPKLVDAERKRVRDILDGWRDQVREPLTIWENDERVRVETITERIAAMRNLPHENSKSSEFEEHIERLKNTVIDESFDEFIEEAAITKDKAMRDCGVILARALIRESEAEELERLRLAKAEQDRIENEQRIAREAATEATRIAEAKAAEKIAKIERQKDRAKLEAAKAKEREQKLKLEQEKAIQDAIEHEEREAAKRAADLIYRQAIIDEATASLSNNCEFLTQEQASEIIQKIANDAVMYVSVRF